MTLNGKMSQERLDLRRAHVLWMALAVEDDILFYPVDISVFRANAIVVGAQVRMKTVKKARFLRVRAGKERVLHRQ